MPLLQLRSVHRSYWRGPREVQVLRDVSLDVEAGALVGIYGQRGSGKTTLLRIAAGFESPDTGVVTYRNRNLGNLSRNALARVRRNEIAWVERGGPHSRELSLLVYVALPLYRICGPAHAQRQAAQALERLGVHEPPDARWESLTHSTRRLAAIAQALVREPRVLIVDDPTAGLGVLDTERVVGLLRSAAEDGGLGILMAVPDMPAMLHAHEVRSLSRGRLLAPADPPPEGAGTVVEFPRGERSA